MSEPGFSVDPPAMRSSGQGIAMSADQLTQLVTGFQQSLSGYGEPWGADDLGSLIGMAYQSISELAMECLQDNITELAGYGEGVTTMADTYEAVDQGVDDGIRRLADGLG